MRVEIYTSRDRRNGEPLNVKQDGYQYEYPDIPVEVELDYKLGEWEVQSARVMEDLPLMQVEDVWMVPFISVGEIKHFEIPLKYLLRKGDEITLDDDEFNEAVERAETIHRDWEAEQVTSKE